MRRRDFITLIGGAPALWPLAARGQPVASIRRVGILEPRSRTDAYAFIDAFKRGLAGLGWAEDRNVRFEERYSADNNEEIAVHATELARSAPDAIFVYSSPALRAMRRASGDIPIVFVAVRDPVGEGFVSSLAHPGGNITGFATGEFGDTTKQLDLLKKMAPSIQRVAVLYDPDNPPHRPVCGPQSKLPRRR